MPNTSGGDAIAPNEATPAPPSPPAIFVLVHSPLVGPGTWKPVADELQLHRHDAVVPVLTPPAPETLAWRRQPVATVCAVLRDVPEPSLTF